MVNGSTKNTPIENVYLLLQNGIFLSGALHRPSNDLLPRPAVIIFHGLAGNKSGEGNGHIKLAEKLASNGICCLRFDFRGSGDSQGSLAELSLNDLKEDALSIIRNISRFPYIDCKKIFLFGSSLGGCLSIDIARRCPECIRGIALWAPVAQGGLWIKEMIQGEYTHSGTTAFMCPDENTFIYKGCVLNPSFIEQFALMDVAAELLFIPDHIQILHLQGENDELVSATHRARIIENLERRNSPYEARLYPEFGHSPGNDPRYETVLDDMVLWFKDKLARSQ